MFFWSQWFVAVVVSFSSGSASCRQWFARVKVVELQKVVDEVVEWFDDPVVAAVSDDSSQKFDGFRCSQVAGVFEQNMLTECFVEPSCSCRVVGDK